MNETAGEGTPFVKDHPRVLIPELCKRMYDLGWATGTGGGFSMRHEGKIFVAPSGVQKESIKGEDLFVLTDEGEDLEAPPPSKKLRKSQCTPLFMCAYKLPGTGAVLHSHSARAVMATLMYPGKEFRVTHLEMIKGIRKCHTWEGLRYDDMLVVPIIENTPQEQDLCDDLQQAILDYPDTCAVLVRRHGIYVWGRSWVEAKTMAECYDYLFGVAVEMKKCGLDPASPPSPLKPSH